MSHCSRPYKAEKPPGIDEMGPCSACGWLTPGALSLSSQGYHSKPAQEPSQCHTTLVAEQPVPQSKVYFRIRVLLSRAVIPAPIPCQHPRLLLAWDHPIPWMTAHFKGRQGFPQLLSCGCLHISTLHYPCSQQASDQKL